MNRREFVQGAVVGAAGLALPSRAGLAHPAGLRAAAPAASTGALGPVLAQVEKQHEQSVKRLQAWIAQPSIAAENRGMNECCEMLIRMLKEAGFGRAEKVPTDGQPGVFAVLDAGAPRTVGIYFMYDVKQVDPAEWTSPPWEARIVEKPGVGKVLVGRGAARPFGSVGFGLNRVDG